MALLKDYISITGGQIVNRVQVNKDKGDEVVDRGRKVIVPKTINNGVIDDDNIDVMDLKAIPDENKLTKEGDIIVKLSKPYGAAMIDKEHEGMLITSFCAVIRDVKGIDPGYLVAYLNSDLADEKLSASVAGTTMTILSNGKICDLDIPVPDINKQKEISEFYRQSSLNKILFKKISKLESEKLSALIEELEK